MNEELLTAEWLVSRIETDTTMEAFLELVPRSVALPAVRLTVRERNDVRGVGDQRERILTQIDWLITVINEGLGVASLIPLANALDAALQNKNGSTSSVQVMSCLRLEPFTMLEPEDSGVYYRHAGGLYRTLTLVP